MPIYEYACTDCGHKFDALQKFDDPPVDVCPKCSASAVKKLISATNFVLKGGGWYSDHYGLKSGEGGAKAEAPAAAAAGAPAAAAPAAAAPAAAPAASAPAASAPASTTK